MLLARMTLSWPVMTCCLVAVTCCIILVLWCRFHRGGKDALPAEETERNKDENFEMRIPEYAAKIKNWFETERPYLRPSFKLVDVAAVVPLNRTYLSRIFNEGMGVSFTDYIRDLRMAEAKRLLAENPDAPIAAIAERCGFAGHSSFHRAFVQATGMKPSDFRAKTRKP